MKILIACEESQEVTHRARAVGHEAYSCDILPPSGPCPEYHLQQDVLPLLTEDWDMIIAFPPCTHLTNSGARWFAQKRADGRQQQAIDFFMAFVNQTQHIPKVVIENPVGIMNKLYRKPDQIIQPWQFGHRAQKRTCLWLKGVEKLLINSEDVVDPGDFYISPSGRKIPDWLARPRNEKGKQVSFSSDEAKRIRSKTFPGIAQAMVDQWMT